MFEAEDHLTILSRLRKRFNENAGNKLTSVAGTFAGDTLSANAVEFEKAYAEMDLIMDAAFPQTSWGAYLTNKAEEHGILRKAATKAVVILKITGEVNAAIPKGSLFSTADGMNFLTVADAQIGADGTAEVKAEAQEAGAAYNVDAETIIKIPVSIYGVQTVANETAAYDGFEEETDAELLERLLFKVRQPATSGNANQYQIWATSVAGVGSAKVLPLWAGNGTVKVLIMDADGNIASTDLITKVKDYIDDNAPIGATVTVTSFTPVAIDIALTATVGTGSEEGIKTAVNGYFKTVALNSSYVSYAQVGNVILEESLQTGITDYKDLTLNEDLQNIELADDEVPVVGEVTLRAQ